METVETCGKLMEKETMAEYIDRAVVRERLERVFKLQAQTARKLVDDIPTADVKTVVRGEWIAYPACLKYQNAYADHHIVCSVCEECFSILDNDTERFNFCPNCGSDMRQR